MKKKKISKKKILYTKLFILILCFIIIMRLFVMVLSKYQTSTNSTAEVDIAFYLLKTDMKEMTLNLDKIEPGQMYTYDFSIGNNDGTNTAEVDINYNLTIRTTTNLPLEYELYMNQKVSDENAQSIIQTNTIAADSDGTYFRTITTNPIDLPYSENKTNLYQLVVKMPEGLEREAYQDIIEMIEITVDGHQIVDDTTENITEE